jgi:hypothetical protein
MLTDFSVVFATVCFTLLGLWVIVAETRHGGPAPPGRAGRLGGGALRTRWSGDARQPVVQGRSFSGLRTAQMWVIRSPATANASTATVSPWC